MFVMTKKYLISHSAERYKQQYLREIDSNVCPRFHPTYTHRECYNRLLSAKTEQDVRDAIGVDGWTENKCNECGKDSQITVQFWQETDYDSPAAFICLECLKLSIEVANGAL